MDTPTEKALDWALFWISPLFSFLFCSSSSSPSPPLCSRPGGKRQIIMNFQTWFSRPPGHQAIPQFPPLAFHCLYSFLLFSYNSLLYLFPSSSFLIGWSHQRGPLLSALSTQSWLTSHRRDVDWFITSAASLTAHSIIIDACLHAAYLDESEKDSPIPRYRRNMVESLILCG